MLWTLTTHFQTNTKIIVTILILAVMLIVSCAPVFANDAQLLYLPVNQEWKYAGTRTHNNNYPHAGISLIAVYPPSGVDLYVYARCRIKNTAGAVILSNNVAVLSEGGLVQSLYIKIGYQGTSAVVFELSGNSNADAYATYITYGTYDTSAHKYW